MNERQFGNLGIYLDWLQAVREVWQVERSPLEGDHVLISSRLCDPLALNSRFLIDEDMTAVMQLLSKKI